MRFDLYQAETARIAAEQRTILDAARAILASGRPLTPLEQSGVLHALQVSIENAIGKAKRILKESGQTVPVSAYDAFRALASVGIIAPQDLPHWNAVIGLRNRIVHDYMNIDFAQVARLIQDRKEDFVIDFLMVSMEGGAKP